MNSHTESTPPVAVIAPLESVKMAVDFVKQLLSVSASLAAFVSGGIYFLRSQAIHISWLWIWAICCLILSLVAGFLAFGSFISRLEAGDPHIRGVGRIFAVIQVMTFFLSLTMIIGAGFVSAPLLVPANPPVSMPSSSSASPSNAAIPALQKPE